MFTTFAATAFGRGGRRASFFANAMTIRRTPTLFLFLFLLLAPGLSAGRKGDDWTVKEVRIDTSRIHRRAALPIQPFEEEKVKEIDKYFTARTVRGQFNGVVLFAQGDKVFTKAYGYADFRSREKLTVSSRFQLASISKTITATAVLMLASEGKIDLGEPVATYLEGFAYPRVTVEMLLSHTSGLPDYTLFTPGAWASTEPMSNEDMLAIMNKRKPRVYFSPGRQYRYCNTNYALLALIVQRVTGEDFASWVHAHIFEPVGMDDTFFCTEEAFASADRMTIGHTSRRGAYQPNFLDGVLGDKGVYSTAEDLLRFDLALRNGFLIDASWQAKAYTNYTDEVHPYGWGWRLDEYQGHRIVYHNGWWHGYKGRFLRLPQEDTTIIVLENQARSSFSVAALMNISKKLFDLPDLSDQEEETGKTADLDAEERG